MQSAEGLGNTFGRSWELLSGNWIMLVPGLVIGIVAAVIVFFVAGTGLVGAGGLASVGAGGAAIGTAMMAGLIVALIMLVAMILTVAYTTGLAGAGGCTRAGRAWRGEPSRGVLNSGRSLDAVAGGDAAPCRDESPGSCPV